MWNIEEGLRALRFVQWACPGAVLAGGYLRDDYLRREAKDIDIFVPYTAGPIDLPGAVPMMGASEYMEQTEVDAIWNVPDFELPVQVIMLAPGLDPIERVKAHDFGICQIWHDGTRLHTTGHFDEDVRNETFTLVSCEDEKEHARSMRRWERLKAKYPEFRLVDHTGFAEL